MSVSMPMPTSFVPPSYLAVRWISAILLLALSSCATYKMQVIAVADEETVVFPETTPVYSLYLVGNTGLAEPDDPVFGALGEQLRRASKASGLVVLGSNVPDGMPPERQDEDYSRAKASLDALVTSTSGFAGKIYVLSGDRDWANYGLNGLKRQQEYLEDAWDEDEVLFPDAECGDPAEIEVNPELTLILLDSEWWLADWTGQAGVNVDCDIRSRNNFLPFYEDAVKGNRNKNVVIAAHHPPVSNGPRGGEYPLKRHLFPLTFLNENAYLPLPVIGSIATLVRSSAGTRQDIMHPRYRDFRNILVDAARKNGSFIFAGSHENNQQYHEQDEQSFIVTGAGADTDPSHTGNGALFTYGKAGFARIDFFDDKESWVTYYAMEGERAKVVQRRQMKKPQVEVEEIRTPDYDQYEASKDSVFTELDERNYERNAIGDFLWGEHYRSTYDVALKVPKLDLATYKGGLIPVKRGGGYQTNSLRLENEEGQQYNMRSVKKDPTRTIPYPFNKSFVKEILQDNFSSAHPLAATALPPMAEAINIYYTQPKLFYVPKQPALSIHNEEFAEALYLVEERPDDDVWPDAENFGYPEDIVSSGDAIEETLEHHDKQIDQDWVVRSRLFDLMIGDWDRHDDQWRWAVFDQGEIEMYRPIPRDRDQAFSKYDGFLTAIVRAVSGQTRNFRPYKRKISKIKWTSYNARYFDPSFLNALEWEDWKREATYIKENLTDEIIEKAFRENWPEAIYDLSAEEIMTKLKGRRDDLVSIARRMYEFRAKEVDIPGTEQEDLFLIDYLEDGKVRVRVWGLTDDFDRKFIYYDRTFLPDETKEIRLYGGEDQDEYRLRGSRGSRAIKVRMIGGVEEDTYLDSLNTGSGRALVYDFPQEMNTIQKGPGLKMRLTEDPAPNTYNRRSRDYEYDFGFLLPSVFYNPDDGILAGVTGQATTYGFRKNPYSTFHTYSLRYAFATSGFRANYRGEFIDVFGSWDVLIHGKAQSALYTSNFYGFGNESENLEDELDLSDDLEDDYYRIRERRIDVFPALMRRFSEVSYLSIGPLYETVRIERTEGRFIDEVGDQIDPSAFDGISYAGGQMTFSYNNFDDAAFPTLGLGVNVSASWRQALNADQEGLGILEGSFSLVRNLDPNHRLVFATRVGGKHLLNDDYVLFQAATLGGIGPNSNFRGFRRDRFTGRTSFYQNIDLRWKVMESGNLTLPFSVGFQVGFDHGRVWFDGEDSDVWHYSYGGGIFISPFDIASISATFFRGDTEEVRAVVGAKFFF